MARTAHILVGTLVTCLHEWSGRRDVLVVLRQGSARTPSQYLIRRLRTGKNEYVSLHHLERLIKEAKA